MLGSSPAGNSTSTTGPVIWITLPVAIGLSLLLLPVWGQPAEASAPETISIISRVIVAWRVLL